MSTIFFSLLANEIFIFFQVIVAKWQAQEAGLCPGSRLWGSDKFHGITALHNHEFFFCLARGTPVSLLRLLIRQTRHSIVRILNHVPRKAGLGERPS